MGASPIRQVHLKPMYSKATSKVRRPTSTTGELVGGPSDVSTELNGDRCESRGEISGRAHGAKTLHLTSAKTIDKTSSGRLESVSEPKVETEPHQRLVREIKQKLESGELTNVEKFNRESISLEPSKPTGGYSRLDDLMKRPTGWPAERTVIVDIDNSQRRDQRVEPKRPALNRQKQVAQNSSSHLDSKLTQNFKGSVEDPTDLVGEKSANTRGNSYKLAVGSQLKSPSAAKQSVGSVVGKTSTELSHREESKESEPVVSPLIQKSAQLVEDKVAEKNVKSQPEVKNSRRLPNFGAIPSKLSRLPYFNQYGKTKSVELKTTNAKDDSRISGYQSGGSLSSNSRSALNSPSGSDSKIPTITRTLKSKYKSYLAEEDDIETSPRHRSSSRSKPINWQGYSNISNLFPAKSSSRQDHERSYPLSFRSTGRRQSTSLSNLNSDRRNLQIDRPILIHSNQRPQSRFASSSSSLVAKQNDNSFGRHYESANNNNKHKRSTTSLNLSPIDNNSATMRRQNKITSGSVSGYGNNRQNIARGSSNYRSRPASTAPGGYLTKHHRSPSASSLLYSGNMGVAPYGPPILDPDCPVHGYSPGLAEGGHSKSTHNLDSNLLYENYPVFYDKRQQQQQQQGPPAPPRNRTSSLYSPNSPTSPTFGLSNGTRGNQNAPNYGTSNRYSNSNAYYNSSSRFSLYHPTEAGVRSHLAPTSEQLRRILGYHPPTKPVHLHPQWAYSRPFIHLGGLRSPSPRGDLDDYQDDYGVIRYEPFNRLHDAQAIRSIDFHPSGEVYAIGSNSRALRICAYPADHELRHFNPESGELGSPRVLFKFLQVHRGSIYSVAFNGSGKLLATGSNDQTVHITRYNPITHSPEGEEFRLTMHDGTVRDICFVDDSSNGSSLLLSAGGGDNKIYVTDCDTITPFQSMTGHTQMVMSLSHVSGASFVSASNDKTIRFWDLRTRSCTSIVSAPPTYGTAGNWVGPGAPVCTVKVDPTGRLLASGHSDSTCMIYDVRGGKIIQTFKPHDDEIRTVSFSPKSYYLLTGGYDGRVVLSDLQGDLAQPLPSVCVAECDDKFVQAKWHPSDFTFVTTSADKTATLWALPAE